LPVTYEEFPTLSILTAMDRVEIAELLNRYAWASDERDFDALAGCFLPDGTLVLQTDDAATNTTVRGSEAIAEWVRDRHRGEFEKGHKRRHMNTGLVITPSGPDRATAMSYVFVLVAHVGDLRPTAMGWYRDDVCKTGGVWRFKQRLVHIEAKIRLT
jgi:ketosteroid isomerase-like protein